MLATLENTRSEFPILQRKIQLSSCSQSALHRDVKGAIARYVQTWEEQGMDWEGWMAACEHARNLFARMIHASPSEIAIVSSVSHGASSIAASIDNRSRKKVLITEFDFPTIGHVWLSHRDRFHIDFIKSDENNPLEADHYEQAVDEQTLLVSTSHVSFYNGNKQDIKAVAEAVHRKGAYLFVDAYQSFGQTPINVKEMGIDMLCTGMQKYGLGIPGFAYLYIDKKISRQLQPRITGWFGQENPFAFDIKNLQYGEHTKRFDSGTFPMINGFAAEAALKILSQLDIKQVESYLETLSQVAIDAAEHYGLVLKSPKDVKAKGSNTAIYVENASAVEKQLLEKGIIVSARNDVIRIAPHYYNTEQDVRTALSELAKI
ncbi:aminotransferase class V-fold PLP-dependent enzyme [Siminovitchia sediminis]|uniref:Aminotransferase class V-fold PLP-dependent enzyme n=1 Tax=Siminovitchia sediminis TaxID=1274353 RepID=A0ABW4KGM8_9BACI